MSIVADRIKARLEALGKTARGASLEAGLSPDAIRGVLRGMSKTPRGETLQRLARVLDCSITYLLGETDDISAAVDVTAGNALRVFVRGTVQAGQWREAVEMPREDWTYFDLPADGRYPGVERFLLKVIGPSMNQVFADGSVIECVRFFDIRRNPRDGDYVVVHRARADGLFEATVKQYVIDEDGKGWLWPRSTHPEHQQPIALEPTEAVEETTVTALVIRATVLF